MATTFKWVAPGETIQTALSGLTTATVTMSGASSAIATGAVAERVIQYDTGAAETLNQIKAVMVSNWTAFQAEVTAKNPWARYGTFFDGTTWTTGGVA